MHQISLEDMFAEVPYGTPRLSYRVRNECQDNECVEVRVNPRSPKPDWIMTPDGFIFVVPK